MMPQRPGTSWGASGMRLALIAARPLAASTPAAAATHRVSNAALIAAAKAAPLRLIDAEEAYCDGDTPIGAWLKALTAGEARRVSWSAGKCELVNDLNPLDAGGGYCAQATLALVHAKSRRD